MSLLDFGQFFLQIPYLFFELLDHFSTGLGPFLPSCLRLDRDLPVSIFAGPKNRSILRSGAKRHLTSPGSLAFSKALLHEANSPGQFANRLRQGYPLINQPPYKLRLGQFTHHILSRSGYLTDIFPLLKPLGNAGVDLFRGEPTGEITNFFDIGFPLHN